MDDDDFAAILAAHRGMLLTRARRRVGPDDAEDLVGETLLRAWRYRGAFVPAHPGGWLAKILANAIADRHRQAARRGIVATVLDLLPDPPDPRPGPDDEALRREAGDALARALGRLPPGQRDAVLLCDRDGATYVEAGAALGVPKATIGTRVMRGRRRLRALLGAR